MTEHDSSHSLLPHHRLRAFGVAVELLERVRAARRATRRELPRIARAEALEAIALAEIAMRAGEA